MKVWLVTPDAVFAVRGQRLPGGVHLGRRREDHRVEEVQDRCPRLRGGNFFDEGDKSE